MLTLHNIAAVVVTFNRKAMLKECVERLIHLDNPKCDVLIVDNASTDGTYDEIASLIDEKQVFYYNTGKNLGGAGGFNFGMKQAVESGYEYVWIMDDDTYVQTDTLSALVKADRSLEGNYGFLSSIAYWTDGELCNMNRQKVSIKNKLECFDGETQPIIMATFVSMFIKSETIMQFGLPISDFFIWSDDLEYTRRISLKMPCYAVPTSKVLHNMNSNAKVGIENDSEDRLKRYEYLYRNEVYVYRREGFGGYAYLLMRVVLHSLRVLLSKGGSKGKKLGIIWRSFNKGFRFHPAVEFVSGSKK